jgi:hypothetical protein
MSKKNIFDGGAELAKEMPIRARLRIDENFHLVI